MIVRALLALSIVILFGAQSLLPYFVPVPGGDGGMLIIGAQKVLESVVVFVLGWYFGSSQSSHDKDRTIADLSAKPEPFRPADRPNPALDIPIPPDPPAS